jgi:hypothetical protein
MRKLIIGFATLCAVLGAYLLYNRISISPSIDADQQANIIDSATDPNTVSFESDIGKIGDVGIGTTKLAYYVKLDENKQVIQEWGFEKLLSEARDIWDIEKPYMNIFRRNFKCYITADKGKVQVETAVGRTTPKDATFSSNVVARILLGPPDDVKESYVYLDKFVFLSDRSRLSTAGPVKFVSEDILMNGTGMEFIYNEQTERLEYFKINDLESLIIKGSRAAMFTEDNSSKENNETKTRESNEPLIVDEIPKAEASTLQDQPQPKQQQGTYYKCTFSKNVLVNSPEQLIFAGDKLCINDIFWSKSSEDQPAEVDAGAAKDSEDAAKTTKPNQQADDNVSERQVTTPVPAEPKVPSNHPKSVILTCEDGFEVVPRDSARAKEQTAADGAEEGAFSTRLPDVFNNDAKRTKFSTRRIDYNKATGDGIASGPSELTFYVGPTSGSDSNEAPVPVKVNARNLVTFSKSSNKVVFEGDCLVKMPQNDLSRPKDVTFTAPEITVNLPKDKSKQPDMTTTGPAVLVFYMEDVNDPNANTDPLPVTVKAEKQARFLAASNQIVFEGDSKCTMFREDPNALTKYILLSEQITVELPADSNEGLSGPATGIKHLSATGKVVRLATTKTAKAEDALAGQIQNAKIGKLLSGIELKCRRFDYDAAKPEFLATGPGAIQFNNFETPEPNEPVGRFSLQKPCVAYIDGFDTLKYLVPDNRIVTDAGSVGKLRMDYFPTVEGRYDEHITTQASAVEAILYEDPNGQMQLSTLSATGGIIYEDKDNEFIGSELFYDQKTAILKVNGDKTHSCYYNGAPADGIEMNVETGEVKAKIVEPGTLRIKR